MIKCIIFDLSRELQFAGTDWVKQAAIVNNFKNNLDKHWYPELGNVFHP
jgi:hypothetical protein